MTGLDVIHSRPASMDEHATLAWPVTPMLASSASRVPEGRGWAYECKWDGMRVLALIHGSRVTLHSRTGRDITAQFPELAMLAPAVGADATPVVLDGEVVALHRGRPSFAQLQPRMHTTSPAAIERLARRRPAAYLVFDLLHVADLSLHDWPYAKRRARLAELSLAGEYMSVPPHVTEQSDAMLKVARELGLEGVLAKRVDAPYRAGLRSRDWLKVRFIRAQEFVVGGWRPGQTGTGRTLGSLAVGYHAQPGDAKLVFAGLVGSGLSQAEQRTLLNTLTRWQQRACPFDNPPAVPADVHFVAPRLVVHVTFSEWTPQGLLRQPVFQGVRDDKPAPDVVRET